MKTTTTATLPADLVNKYLALNAEQNRWGSTCDRWLELDGLRKAVWREMDQEDREDVVELVRHY